MTCEEVDVLRALWRIEPWGDERADMRMRTMMTAYLATKGVTDLPDNFLDYLRLYSEPENEEENHEAVRSVLRG